MADPTIFTTLVIKQLELSVNLGWRSAERRLKQPVLLDIDIQYPVPPKACETDTLEDTSCYAVLVNTIREKIVLKQYKLVEHLGFDIYRLTKDYLPALSKIVVRVTKHPKLDGLTGGVCFSYGDK
jgi:FolB domain-containing protein